MSNIDDQLVNIYNQIESGEVDENSSIHLKLDANINRLDEMIKTINEVEKNFQELKESELADALSSEMYYQLQESSRKADDYGDNMEDKINEIKDEIRNFKKNLEKYYSRT